MKEHASFTKVLFVIGLALIFSCSNPYINPQTSKALSEEKQLQESQKLNKLIEQQNKILERIATAIENKK